jgi:hypothetical protein
VSRRSRRRASKRRRPDRDRHHSATDTYADTPRERILHEEYRYVLADLRRIAVLASAMVALLVALSFLLR